MYNVGCTYTVDASDINIFEWTTIIFDIKNKKNKILPAEALATYATEAGLLSVHPSHT